MRRRNAQRFGGEVAKQRRRRAQAPAKARKRTEEDGIASPSTRPAEECVRFSESSPTPFQMTFNSRSVPSGEDSESAALGVESVLRKARDERRCAARRLAQFRYALSNRTRGRFSRFSPTLQSAPERHLSASGEKRV